MRQVLVDANVFVSFLVGRNESQRAAAKALIDAAGDGEVEALIAIADHYDAIATFDQKMLKRMRSIGVESYW